MYNKEIIRRLYKDGRYKQITDLYDYRVSFCKFLQTVIKNGEQITTLTAYVWKSADMYNYKKYSATALNCPEDKNIRKMLINDIIGQIIKNEIMML